jgi:hypothetical protein
MWAGEETARKKGVKERLIFFQGSQKRNITQQHKGEYNPNADFFGGYLQDSQPGLRMPANL